MKLSPYKPDPVDARHRRAAPVDSPTPLHRAGRPVDAPSLSGRRVVIAPTGLYVYDGDKLVGMLGERIPAPDPGRFIRRGFSQALVEPDDTRNVIERALDLQNPDHPRTRRSRPW